MGMSKFEHCNCKGRADVIRIILLIVGYRGWKEVQVFGWAKWYKGYPGASTVLLVHDLDWWITQPTLPPA